MDKEKEDEKKRLDEELEVLLWGVTKKEYAKSWGKKEKVKKEIKEDELV